MDKKYGILIVDDEEDIVDQLYDYFRRDYQVYKANDCAMAQEILKENEIQLVMTDQRMPKMQGTELLKILKEEKPEITRFLMTGYTDLTVAIDAINEGNIHRYLSKPLNFEELSGIISEGLEQFEETVKVKNIIHGQKSDIIDKIKAALGQLETAKEDKGNLEDELKAAKEVEDRIQKEKEEKISELESDKAKMTVELSDLNEKIGKMLDDFDKAKEEALKLKGLEDDNKKVKIELQEVESKYILLQKSSKTFKTDIDKLTGELAGAKAEKERIEKKLKQFQQNWGKV